MDAMYGERFSRPAKVPCRPGFIAVEWGKIAYHVEKCAFFRPPMTVRFLPNLAARLRSGCRRIAASRSSDSATALFPARSDSAHCREASRILTAGAVRRLFHQLRADRQFCGKLLPGCNPLPKASMPGVEAVDPALYRIETATQAVDGKLRLPTVVPLGGHRVAAPFQRIGRPVEDLARDRIMPVSEYDCLNVDRFTDGTLDRKAASLNFRCDALDEDALSPVCR